MHAFIIEDDYLISQAIQDVLSGLGFSRFSFARSEDAAIAGATGEAFDLITADARLLPGDGIKAVETICERRQVPVIFVTGYVEDIRDRLQRQLPQAEIIGKPIREAELIEAVRRLVPPGQQ